MRKLQNVVPTMLNIRRGLVAAAAMTVAIPLATTTSYAQEAPFSVAEIKAITFDVQGTLVDYSAPFTRVSAAIAKRKGTKFEWAGFLADWNTRAAMNGLTIVSGKRPWAAVGFRTAYIVRPDELGPDTKVDRAPEPFIDVYADSLTDLARKLDVSTGRSAH